MVDIKRVQKRLLDMAVVIKDILESHNIPYVITYGTLLGAVRHGGFIPWDDDFDIYLFDDTYELAIDVLKKSLPSNMFLENEDSEPLYFHGWAHVKDLYSETICDAFPLDGVYSHHGISIDLYKATKIGKNQLKSFQLKEQLAYFERKYKHNFLSKKCFYEKRKQIERERKMIVPDDNQEYIYAFMSLDGDYMTMEETFPLKRYKFEDTEFWGQNNYDTFLKRCYGDYMSLPPIEGRHPHYSSVIFL